MIFNLLRASLLFSALLLVGCGSSDSDDPKSPAVETEDWFADSDGDGFGDPAVMVADLFAPTGFVAENTDCDDSDASINPDALEIANGKDDDCDGTTDEVETKDWFADSDGDGFGDPAVMVADLLAPTGFVADNTDCDDSDGSINPDAVEIENDKDDDCDGTTDLAFYYVFASSVDTYTGDFAQFDLVTNNGLTGADNECQRLADASPLRPGIYKAWLSDSSAGGSAAERLTQSPAPYHLSTDVPVADDWADFTDGRLDDFILTDEAGNVLLPRGVYTGTDASGASTGINCTNWSSASVGQTATTGLEDQKDSVQWTNIGALSCNLPLRLYCIQQ